MMNKSIAWSTGTGFITAVYNGSGNGNIQITSDLNNLYVARSMQITVKTNDGSKTKTITVNQTARVRTDLSSAIVTAANQLYDGTAKTPSPTVTLNGSVIASSNYDVAYSDNTNAGTATITITGKGDYTGTATGNFTIAVSSYNYVQNGLMNMWDGIENTGRGTHSNSASTWKDLVGSMDMTKNSGTWDASGLNVNGTWKAATLASEITGVYTIEVVCKSTKDKTAQLVFNARTIVNNNGEGFGNGFAFRGNNTVNFSNGMDYFSISDARLAATYAIKYYGPGNTYNYLYYNGVRQTHYAGGATFGSFGNQGISCSTKISSNNKVAGNYPFYGKVYCIRLYNRELSDSELAQNYEIDKERFDL